MNFVLGIVNNLEFDQSKLYSNEPSPIYDQNGEVVYTLGSMNDGTRENITYDDLPQVLVDARCYLKTHVFLNITVLTYHVS